MRQSPRIFVCILLAFFAVVPSIPAQSSHLTEIVPQLRLIETSENGWPSTDVPPVAQKLLPEMKAELRTLFGRAINEHGSSSPEAIRTFLVGTLRDAGVGTLSEEQFENNYNPNAEQFGYIADIQVRQATRHSNLLTVVVSLTIPCGQDDSLTVFQHIGSTWQPVIAADSNGYTEVNGAQGWLKYAVSPPDTQGNWFLVTANVTPWCTSNWQGLKYSVLRRGPSPETPRVLLGEHKGVYLGVDEPFRLTITSGGFEIHNVGNQGLDASLLTRVHVQKYRVAGDEVTRIPPFALLPEDFLDEWFGMKWEEASRWVTGEYGSELERWHRRFNSRGQERDFFTEFDFVQPCPTLGTDAKWQIGLSLEGSSEKDLPEDLPEELFFTITQREGAFYVTSVAEKRPAGCPGESRPRAYSLNSPLP